jgi:NADPH-dependent 2,4-dienoyl-CoA reductase/sulfur reductase-like enzyme/pSer/pThr/pTyr-binding forkhead associated (FHA) protein
MSRTRSYIIIGDGAAGTTAAQELRKLDANANITIFSDDPQPAYFRAALTNYLLGELREDQIFAVPPSFYHDFRVHRVMARVAQVDTARSQVFLAQGGRPIPYDALLLACGARANPPPWEGNWLPGVMTMRTMHDVRRVMDLVKTRGLKHAVVVGGGPLALEWAHGLNIRGVKITMMVREQRFLPSVLDTVGSDLLAARLRRAGVDVRLGDQIHAAGPNREGRVGGVVLKSGTQLACELVAVAIGVICNTEFLAGSHIELGKQKGVLVNDYLRANIPNVYAAGDVAAVNGNVLQLWEPARVQGQIAARNMAGGNYKYAPGVHYMATRLYDLDFASIGAAATSTPGAEEIVDFPQQTGRISYRKVVMQQGKIKGALFFGERQERVRKHARMFKRLIDEQIDVTAHRAELLDPLLDWNAIVTPRALINDKQVAAAGAGAVPAATQAKFKGTQAISLNELPAFPLSTGSPDAKLQKNGTSAMPSMAVPPTLDSNAAAGKLKGTQAIFSVRPDLISAMPPQVASHDDAALNKAGTMAVPAMPGMAMQGGPAPPFFLEGAGGRFELQGPSALLGSDPACNMPLRDPNVSSTHAQLTRSGNDVFLRDLGSASGTWCNGNPVILPIRLKTGDRIRIGSIELVVRIEGMHAASGPPGNSAVGLPSALLGSGEARPHFEVRSGQSLGLSFALDPQKPQMSIGSDPVCEIRLDDPSIMRRHAILQMGGNVWNITDANSYTGTFILRPGSGQAGDLPSHGNQRLAAGTWAPLREGDMVKLGEVLLVYTSRP